MKKLLIIGATLLTFVAFAQEGTNTSSAIIALQRPDGPDIKEAKEYIEVAREAVDSKGSSNVKKKDLAKFLHYYAIIHWKIYKSSDEEIKALDEEALDKAVTYFYKSYEYETSIGKNYFKTETQRMMPMLSPELTRRAIQKGNMAKAAEAQEDEKTAMQYRQSAYDDFMMAYELTSREPLNFVDTTMYYNAGFMMVANKNYDKAIEHFSKLIEMGYKGIAYEGKNAESGEYESFPNERMAKTAIERGTHTDLRQTKDLTADLYKLLASAYRLNEDMDNYTKTLTKARQLYPDSPELILEELQVYLNNKEYDKALVNIEKALENDPENILLLFNRAIIYYNNLNEVDKAKMYFEETLKVDPDHADANYMMGVIYIAKANEYVDKMNKLGTSASDTKKFEALKAEQKTVFKKAAPYLEKANEVNPDDRDVLTLLREVYFKTGKQQEALKINKQLESM